MYKTSYYDTYRRGAMLAGILFLLLLLIPAATAQTAPVDENQTYILDSSMLPASDYNDPLTGVYLVAPNGSGSLPAQLSLGLSLLGVLQGRNPGIAEFCPEKFVQ